MKLSSIYILFEFILFFFLICYFINVFNFKNYKKWIGITTSSDNHFHVSVNLILSFFITHPNNILIYYDMDLNKSNKIILKMVLYVINMYLRCYKYKGKLLLYVFNFSLYPSHFTVGNYSWKQIMIYDNLIKYKQMVFWFDAGVELNNSVTKEINLAYKYDFYMPQNKAKLLDYLPIKSTETMKINRKYLQGKCDGDTGYFVINYNQYMMKNIIKKWVDCAYNPMCICPPGASRKNSRYEQVTFTALLYMDKKYKNLVGSFPSFNNHKQQCDHRNDCYIHQKKEYFIERIKKCHIRIQETYFT